jgi:hypothetical protein
MAYISTTSRSLFFILTYMVAKAMRTAVMKVFTAFRRFDAHMQLRRGQGRGVLEEQAKAQTVSSERIAKPVYQSLHRDEYIFLKFSIAKMSEFGRGRDNSRNQVAQPNWTPHLSLDIEP